MTSAQIIIVVTIVLYLVAMVFVGVYFGKKGSGSSSDDFYLGGRKMGPVVTAMSAEASDMSSYLLMGLPGLAYLCGLPEVTWTAIGLAIGTYLNWLIVARRLRRYSAKLGAITIPDFFARRFGDKKHLLSCIAAVVILIFFIPYTASGFKAIGTLFNSLFGVEYHTAMIVGGIVVVLYTVMGGFMAVSFTDLIQSIFMTIALIVIVCFGVQQAGGQRLKRMFLAGMKGQRIFPQGLGRQRILQKRFDAAYNQTNSPLGDAVEHLQPGKLIFPANPLHIPESEFPRRIDQRFLFQSHAFQIFHRQRLGFILAHFLELHRPQRQIVHDRQMRVEVELLKDH